MARPGCATEPGLDSLYEAWSRYLSTPEFPFIVIVVVKASVFHYQSMYQKILLKSLNAINIHMFFFIYYIMFLFWNLYILYKLYLYSIFLHMFVHSLSIWHVDELHIFSLCKSRLLWMILKTLTINF